MKNTKRVLSLVLAMVMLVTCFTFTAVADETTTTTAKTSSIFSDVLADAVYLTAVETLNRMGVINGYEDGSFRPDQNVTRAEFTAMLMRTLNYGKVGSTSAADLPFSDVSDTDTSINWAIPNINTAYSMGIINGYEDGTFRPNANVAYEEAIKMIVCTLGYGSDVDTSANPWYTPYTTQANRLGITKNANNIGAPGTPASRACIAQLLYDSLEVKLVEQGNLTDKTILTEYMGYVKNTGLVASDGTTSLTSPDVDLADDQIMIYAEDPKTGEYETAIYSSDDEELKKYLGYEIEFYYKDNGGKVRALELYVVNKANEVELDAELIDEDASTDSKIEYYESDSAKRTTSLKLSDDNIVIYNGKLYGADEDESRFDISMIPSLGTILLIDSDGDKEYDVIKINDYEVYYVSSKINAEYAIVDDVTRSTDKVLYLDVDGDRGKTKIVDKDGKEISYSSISTGDIICVAMSRDDNGGDVLKTAVVVDDSVSGTITGVDDDVVTIGSTDYEYSKAAPWMDGGSGLLEEPQLQDSGVYCLDINGDIVAYKASEVTESVYYGYIMGYAEPKTSSFDDEVYEVRVLNQNGSDVMIMLDEDVRVNGDKFEAAEDILKELDEAAENLNTDPDYSPNSRSTYKINQVIKYTTRTVNGDTTFARIYTAQGVSKGTDIKSDELNYYSKIDASETMEYNSTSKQLKNDNGSIKVDNSIVFIVPSDRTEYEEYAKKNPFRNDQDYYIEAFDVTTTGTAKVIVCYGDGGAETPVDQYSPVYVLNEDIETSKNDAEGETMEYLNAYSSSYSTPKGTMQNWNSLDSEYTPEFGDVFRAGTDKDGYAKLLEEDLIYRAGETDASDFGIDSSSKSDIYSAYYTMILGSVAAIDDSSISIIPEYISEDDTVEDITGDAENFLFSEFSGARVLQYDNSGRNLEVDDVSDDYEGILKSLTPYNEDEEISPTKVLLYMSRGRVRLFCVLDED